MLPVDLVWPFEGENKTEVQKDAQMRGDNSVVAM